VNGLTSVSYRADTVQSKTEVYNQQPIHHRNYFWWLRAEVSCYGMQKVLPTNFGQNLMACDRPPCGYAGSEEKIASVQITSNADYETGLPAGVNLATVFQICAKKTTDYSSQNFYKAEDYQSLETYLASSPSAFYEAYLRIKKTPTLSKKHIFTITYTQTNGEIYTTQTPEIAFQ
jgi:hypothetical protein